MKKTKKSTETPLFITHVYDIDFFEILDQIKEKFKVDATGNYKEKIAYVTKLEKDFVKKKKKEGIDLKVQKANRHYIMLSSEYLYPTILAYKLLTIDPYLIQAVLSYQSVLFLGNDIAAKDNFIGLIEFNVYKQVRSNNLENESIRLDKITSWLESNRKFLLKNSFTAKRVTMEVEFAKILVTKLEPYFDAWQHPDLFKAIFKDIDLSKKLIFNESLIQLTDLFKRLRANKKIKVKSNKILAEWIVEKFWIEKDGIENKYPDINIQVVEDYLVRKDRRPSAKSGIICEDIAPEILEN